MKLFIRYSFLLPLLFSWLDGKAQTVIDTFYFETDGMDTRVYQGSTGTNYATDSQLGAFFDYGPPNYGTRTYMQMNLSSLPTNAIIAHSYLNMYALSVSNAVSHDVLVDRVTTSWTETSPTWSSLPTVTTSGRVTIPDAQTTNTGWHSYEITTQVQTSVINPSTNYGWRISVNESGTSDKGIFYASSEHGTSAYRPYLIVEYYLPMLDTVYVASDGYDSQTYSGAATTNYASLKTMKVFWDYNAAGSTAYRSYVNADVSVVPRENYVPAAYLHLYAEAVDNTEDHPIDGHQITGTWTESGVTWNNEPTFSNSNLASIDDANTSSLGWHVMDVRPAALTAVRAPEKYFGWKIKLHTESGSADHGMTYASSESDSLNRRPYLVIEHQVPVEVTGYVTHCTNGNSDGSIEPVITGGCWSYVSYVWRSLSAGTLTSLESGTNIANAGISGLADGLYVLEVTDYRGGLGYQYFFVGEEGVTTHVEFANSVSTYRVRYGEDSFVEYSFSPADSFSTGGSIAHFLTRDLSGGHGKSYMQYFVDWDPALEFTRADQTLIYNQGHYQTATSDNDAWISRVLEPWYEHTVNWSIRPDVTTHDRVYIPTTTTNNTYVFQNDTVSILDFVPHWQEDFSSNHGVELALNSFAQTGNASRGYCTMEGGTGYNLLVSYTVILANTKYWVGEESSDWNDPLNWSTTSGGSGGAGVPNIQSTVIFDENGNINCYSSTNEYIKELVITSGYTANIDFGGSELISTLISTANE